ncbi:MAG: hypothetical protein ABIT01_20265 [Thermoanaerobaculia bacterium]
MPRFPADFLEPDGRFRDLLPGDFVPVFYITRDGSWICAGCLNTVRVIDDPLTTDDAAWRVASTELHYEGPEAVCDQCGLVVASLYGDPDEPESS